MSEMAATATAPPAPATDEAPYAIRPITVDEYHRMLEVGILYEKEPVELLDGQLIAMPPEGSAHGAVVTGLTAQLVKRFDGRALVRPGNALRISDRTELQPDFAVVRYREDFYSGALPVPSDVLFVIEVSHSTLAYDRRQKLRAYASAGIPEVWIVDVERKRVEAYTKPHGDAYTKTRVAERNGSLAPSAFPDEYIAAATFLR